MANHIAPPQSIDALIDRVNELQGMSLAQCASRFHLTLPASQQSQKGVIGVLMEALLGADASSRPIPDFSSLNIELKTLPIGFDGKPTESTFVASINLMKHASETWQTSIVKKKLSHVLWLPIEGIKDIPLPERRIGIGFLWQPNEKESHQLEDDWNDLSDLIVMGRLDEISAKMGEVLQIRPKAAHGRVLRDAIDDKGHKIKTLPRGFYLRPSFTYKILAASTCF